MPAFTDETPADAMMRRAQRRRFTRGIYDGFRCPAHGELVGLYDGVPVGKCSGCAAEAAQGILTMGTRQAEVDL